MLRRNLIRIGGCFPLAIAAVANQQDPNKQQVVQVAPRNKFEIEVVAPRKSLCHAHKIGERFAYPQDLGRMCPWLRDSISGIQRAMEWGAVFPWDYDGTPYKKISDRLLASMARLRQAHPKTIPGWAPWFYNERRTVS